MKQLNFKGILKFLQCFYLARDYRYRYIGVTWNIFDEIEETNNYKYLEELIKFIAKEARPWYLPWFVLNLLHLYGNDNSIIRVKNWKLHRLHKYFTKGILIQDIKIKWGTIRVYGYFNEKITQKLKEIEDKINPTLKPY